jgi:hypothetical protein
MIVGRYLLADYVRSRRFVAPLLLLAVGVALFYSQPGMPVLSTAGACAAYLFPIQCWVALSFLNAQSASDRYVLAATVGGRRFVVGRLLAAGALAAFSSVLALGYPLVSGAYERTPHLNEIGLILSANLIATVSGTALSALFAQPIVQSRAVSVFGIAVCALLTVPLDLPPTLPTARALDTIDASQVPARLIGDLVTVSTFALGVTVICARLWRRRE